MYKILLVAILFLAGCSGIRNVPYNQFIPKMTEKVYRGRANPVLRIKASEFRQNCIISSCGTAFVSKYKEDLVIITAFHVTMGGNHFRFYTEDRKRVNVLINKIVFLPELDTTIFFVSHISAKIIPIEYSEVKIGSSCTTTGFPANGNRKTYSGKILGSSLDSSSVVLEGMSGGPVKADGKVIGIISARVETTDGRIKSSLIRLSDVFDTLNRVR